MSTLASEDERYNAYVAHAAKLAESEPNDAGLHLTTFRFATEASPSDHAAVVAEVRQIESEFDVMVGVLVFPDQNKGDTTGTLCAVVGSYDSLMYFIKVFYGVDVPEAPPTRKREIDEHPDAENIRSARRHNHGL